MLLILDDLQWVDTGSASLLFHLGRRIIESPKMIIGAFRPAEVDLGRAGERHPLESVLHELKRDFGDFEVEVDRSEDRKFVDAFLDTEPNRLNTAFREMLFKQTRGHPLFTIELLRDMQDRCVLVKDKKGQWVEGPELNWDSLPARVDAVIEERISRLTEKLRDILTLASVEGEEFTAEVVAHLQETELRKLVRLFSSELDKRHHLVRAKGIRHLERQRLSLYIFQHILFQRYLYNSLDEVERAHLHGDVGNMLEALYGEQIDEIAIQLARHFQEAGIATKAIEYLQKAGNKAAGLCANEEAVAHFQKGLEILKTLPDTPERVQQELGMQLGLAVPLSGIKGYGEPAVGETYSRARILCQQIGEKPQLITALFLLSIFYFSRAEHQTALEIQEQLVRLAQKIKDPLLIALTHSTMAWILYSQGRFASAQTHLDKMNSFYDFKKHGSLAFIYGFDPGMASLAFSACNLWCLGYPDQALDCCIKSVDLARKVNHPYTLAFALAMASMFNLLRRESQALKELAEELVQLSREKGFLLYAGIGNFKSGRALCEQGQIKEGIARINQGLAVYEATGQRFTRIELLTCLAEAYGKAGEVGKGLKLLSDAFLLLEKSEERYFESTLYRVRGELLLMKGVNEYEVDRDYQKAIDVARGQNAKSMELRATMSLARLWQKKGKKKEAFKILKEIYDWFTEGFDTQDLKDAKALLEELS
jgi:predicted ATPase